MHLGSPFIKKCIVFIIQLRNYFTNLIDIFFGANMQRIIFRYCMIDLTVFFISY